MSLVDGLGQLCELLSVDPVTGQEVADALGIIEDDEGEGGDIYVRPADRAFKEVIIVQEDDSNIPAYVELHLSPSVKATVKDLQREFGNYSKLPKLHWDSPDRVMFFVEKPGRSFACAILVNYELVGKQVDKGIVTAITVRRDEL